MWRKNPVEPHPAKPPYAHRTQVFGGCGQDARMAIPPDGEKIILTAPVFTGPLHTPQSNVAIAAKTKMRRKNSYCNAAKTTRPVTAFAPSCFFTVCDKQ